MDNLNNYLYGFRNRLKEDVGIDSKYHSTVSSTIFDEMSYLSSEYLLTIETSSPVKLAIRIEELHSFNLMMERVNLDLKRYPEIVRAQVIVQNYIAFVYLKDNCFEITKRIMPSGTLTKRICNFLLNNPIRAFRNSIAHGNWHYSSDFKGIDYYAHKGEIKTNGKSEIMSSFYVGNDELDFWQALARITAYTIYSYIVENKKYLNDSV